MNIHLTSVSLIVIGDSIKLLLFFILAILIITISIIRIIIAPDITTLINITLHIMISTFIVLTSVMIIIPLLVGVADVNLFVNINTQNIVVV